MYLCMHVLAEIPYYVPIRTPPHGSYIKKWSEKHQKLSIDYFKINYVRSIICFVHNYLVKSYTMKSVYILLIIELHMFYHQVRRLHCMIKDRDSQFKHELKKKERELNKLKEKLNNMITQKTPNRRMGKIY